MTDEQYATLDKRLTVLELRAEFQGQSMKWMAVIAPLVIGGSAVLVAVLK